MQAVFSYWQSFLSVSYSRCRQAWVLSITFLQSISFRPVYLHVNMTDIHSATDVWSGHICNWSCPECPDNSNHQMLHCNKFLKLLFFIFTKTLKPKLATADHQSKVRDQRPSIYVIPGNEWSWSVWNCGCSRRRVFCENTRGELDSHGPCASGPRFCPARHDPSNHNPQQYTSC